MDEPVTRRELHEALDIWAGAIMSQMSAQLAAQTAHLTAEIAASEQRYRDELARHVRASEKNMRTWIAGLDDKYRDLPARVSKLEVKVFAPRRKRASAKARRRVTKARRRR
jgi:hypothetical protein